MLLGFALGGAEEQGLNGSAAYVQKHLAGDANKAARDKLATYFNIDPGSEYVFEYRLRFDALGGVPDRYHDLFRATIFPVWPTCVAIAHV
mgnify:CR=1 FL=1